MGSPPGHSSAAASDRASSATSATTTSAGRTPICSTLRTSALPTMASAVDPASRQSFVEVRQTGIGHLRVRHRQDHEPLEFLEIIQASVSYPRPLEVEAAKPLA